jgi:CDP-6-deoxy-D-xylo-4-hexulose-3-dehydrase
MIKLVSDTIDKIDINCLIDWLKENPKLTKGNLTVELEQKWSEKIGVKHTVFVNSGSSSILLTLASLKFSDRLKNNKIVVPNLSWATDVSSPVLLGMDTILVDCNLSDLSVDLNQLEEIFKIQSPSAFILVSVLGLVPDMEQIMNLCTKYDVILLEDVCESMGSKYKNKYLGTFGYASFFSLYYGHHLSTIEGGFICTDNDDFYDILLSMRSHGWDRDLNETSKSNWRSNHNFDSFSALYKFYYPGFNVRSTDLQAFIGLRQLDKLDKFSEKRNYNFKFFNQNIQNELKLKISTDDFISNFAYPIVSYNRKNIVSKLIENNIEVRPLIAGSMASNPFVIKYVKTVLPLPNSELIEKYGFYIPNHQGLTDIDLIKIKNIINCEH